MLALGMTLAAASPALAGADTTLVSVAGSGSAAGNGPSRNAVITPNGRWVAFDSAADDLASGDDNGALADVYLRDVRDGVTSLVSVKSSGAGAGDGPSVAPSVSDNGRWVAFVSSASNLVPNDTNGVADVFVRDLATGVTTLVSVAQTGASSAGGASSSPTISANGRYVSFASVAEDLVANDDNGVGDVFVRDLQSGTTKLVSVDRQGSSSAAGLSRDPVMTPSGRYVAFVSLANDLVADDDNTASDVFLRDVKQGTTTLVSVSRSGMGGGKGDSYAPLVSPNGRRVAFTSVARDIVTADRNHASDVFVRDLRQQTTTLVSLSKNGKRTGSGASVARGMTPSGRYVVFTSAASNLVAGDRNDVVDVFLRDLRLGTTQLVSADAAGRSGDAASEAASLSSDGRYVLFASSASDLVAAPTSGNGDVFLRDVVGGVTALVSDDLAGTGGGNGRSDAPTLTPDGRHALFHSVASDLVAGHGSGSAQDVFRRVLP